MSSKPFAIVTMALGKAYQERFERCFLPALQRYADRNRADLIIHRSTVDDSKQATQRHVSWQKCPMLFSSALKHYQRVCWVDADMLFTEQAPNLFELGKFDCIGITQDQPSVRHPYRNSPQRYYRSFGLETGFHTHRPFILQGGLILFSPDRHQEVFRRVYEHQYRDRLNHYEQPALGYEIISHESWELLDQRFNYLIGAHFGWYQRYRPWVRLSPGRQRQRWLERAMKHQYVIHFAGAMNWMDRGSAIRHSHQSPIA